MKKKLFISLIFVMTLFFSFGDAKFDRIAIVNLEQVVEKLFSGSKSTTIQSIKIEKQKIQDNLNKTRDSILKLEDEKSKETDDTKKSTYDKKIDELKKQYTEYYKNANQIEQKLKTIQESLFKDIFAVAKKIAENEGYTIVFDSANVFYFSSDNDITQKVIDRFKSGQ